VVKTTRRSIVPSHRHPTVKPRGRRPRKRRATLRSLALPLLAAAAALLAGALLAACGSSSADPSPASSQAQAEAKFAEFAKCLREHGITAEAISHPGGGQGLKVSPGKAGAGPAVMEAAQKACERYRPQPKAVNLSPQQKVEREEQVEKFARCMREHGIKLEVTSSGGGVQIRLHAHAGEGGPIPESPGFKAAQTACQKLLPFKGVPPGPGG
jgi:hypothetical protein